MQHLEVSGAVRHIYIYIYIYMSLGFKRLIWHPTSYWVTVHSFYCCNEYKLHLYQGEVYIDLGLDRKQNMEQLCCYKYFSAKINTIKLIEHMLRWRLMLSPSPALWNFITFLTTRGSYFFAPQIFSCKCV